MRDLGKNGENFKAVIFAAKSFVSMQNFTGSSLVLFSSFCIAYFCQKTNLKFFIWTFSKLLDDMKAIFEPIDLQFDIYIVNTEYIHDTHIVRFF